MTKVIDMKHLQMITMMCVICVTASCTTQKIAYRERFEDAKGYALYACIAHMNKFVDSTSFINKDYSGEYFVQLSSLSLEEIIRIKEYVNKECMNYWSISQNPEGNMIAYSSWKFYNSKDLDNFIHKTLRKNIGNVWKGPPFRWYLSLFKAVLPTIHYYILYRTSIFECCFRQKEA